MAAANKEKKEGAKHLSQIMMEKQGNSYVGQASSFIGHKELQETIKTLLAEREVGEGLGSQFKFFVYVVNGESFDLKAAKATEREILCYITTDPPDTRMLLHFGSQIIRPSNPSI